jgi:antitoxin component YwqK of YwqJK toxin-antitoxin module
MRNGKPDGYWKTYNTYGQLISEGNRKDFLLDSTWKFYNELGKVNLIINYKKGKKSGIRKTYLPDKILVDSFENDIKNFWSKVLYINGKMKSKTYFKSGLENGWAYNYAEDGRIIIRTLYNNGFIRKREYINAYNRSGNKQGLWKEFDKDYNVISSGTYNNGIKDGYFKYYDKEGNLIKIEKYIKGILEENPDELATYELRTDYYEDGSIKVIGSYKDGKPEGVRREFAKDGSIKDGYILHNGLVVGHGIIDEAGKKQGDWKEFYDNGRLRAEGKYVNNKRVGKWIYYFENGKIEQTGSYDNRGLYTGDWKWYFEDGSERIIEKYFEGEREGDYLEYSSDNEVMMQGEYVNGSMEGDWTITVNGFIEKGTYLDNVKDGLWKYYYTADTLYFEGRFVDGNADGKHTWFYRNGKIMKSGAYMMGLKEGYWKYYDEDGKLVLKIKFEDGIEQEYDAVKIEPELKLSDMEE